MIQMAMDFHRQGRLPEAERLYRTVLAQQPDQFEALHFLGVLKLQQGHPDEAFALISKAVQRSPNSADALSNLAAALVALRRFQEAVAICDRILAMHPSDIETLCNRAAGLVQLGRPEEALAGFDKVLTARPKHLNARFQRANVLAMLGRYEEALAAYDALLALDGRSLPAMHNRGNVLLRLGRFQEALTAFDMVLTAMPANLDAVNGRALALKELGRHQEALAACAQALTLDANHFGALITRANILIELKRPDEALAVLDKTIELYPDNPDALGNRGFALGALGNHLDALESYERALAIRPGHASTLNNRGNALFALGRNAEALASYELALQADSNNVDALCNRGMSLHLLNRWQEAVADYARAVTLAPNHGEATFGLCMAQLPILYARESEISGRRAAYEQSLVSLCENLGRKQGLGGLAKAVGTSQPFFLAYQGYSDKDLQRRYGSLVCRIMAERYPPAVLTRSRLNGEPVKVGIVSGAFWSNSVWKIPIQGWLSQLDRERFSVFGYATAPKHDAQTRMAAAMCHEFRQGPRSLDGWREAILADAPDVLLFPEIGMDPVSVQLAAQRLAPVQCTSWGHPDTSGFPTLDYFLSSDLMEPGDADEHYTERLIRLPNLSIYYEPANTEPSPLSRADFGLRPGATVFWCGQSLYKYLPQFDDVFPRIAAQAGECQFVFIESQFSNEITELFLRRLDSAFAARGMNAADYRVILPRLDGPRFSALFGQCDVVLDSIGWSGCNTTLESLPYDLPVVTTPGPLMRGRHSLAILSMMGVTDTITQSIDDYVATAVRLANDVSWRKAVAAKMAANKHRVYRDRVCIEALQDFLDNVARGNPPGTRIPA